MNNYFEDKELRCKCGCNQLKFDAEFKNTLNEIRHELGKPMYISSGYRCEKHNKEVGGKPGSAHTKGKGADVVCENSVDRFNLIRIAIKAGIKRIGVSSKFIHLDNDESKPYPVIWTY